MIPDAWRRGEVAVIGLARTGTAVGAWLVDRGVQVYASDAAGGADIAAAAGRLRARGASVDVGRHDLERIARCVAAIVSPGVPPEAPAIAAARDAGVPVRAELDVAAAALETTKLAVVTGTNGKSTTTALAAHILIEAGVRAEAAGNIGRPLIAVAGETAPPAWVVVEASSFQLHDAPDLRPAMGVVTNLSPDHLDRYASVEAYYGDKRLLFRNATPESVWILNDGDAAVRDLAAGVPGGRRGWRLDGPADAWFDSAGQRLMLDHTPLLDRTALPLLGDHNVENALAATLVASEVGVHADRIAAALVTFAGLPHRLESVGDVEGVRWINDSKATNVSSAVMGVRAMDGPFVVILGGRHKGESYARLASVLGEMCRGVVAYGEAAVEIARDVGGTTSLVRVDNLEEAVARAAGLARPGDTVLFSPACSSFDQFANYEERGRRFRALVEAR